MSVLLADFLTRLMREGQYGDLATLGQAGDRVTLDLLAAVNGRLADIWGRVDWKWSREALKVALVPGTRQYSLGAISGNPVDRIQDVIPFDAAGVNLVGKPIKERTTRHFYSDTAAPGYSSGLGAAAPNIGYPSDYYIVGLNANGQWVIIVDPVPNTAGFLGGYAKAVMPVYVMADVQANNPIAYFPSKLVEDTLFFGCMVNVGLLSGKLTPQTALPSEQFFEHKIARLVADNTGVATDNTPITTRLPSTVGRLRRGGRRC